MSEEFIQNFLSFYFKTEPNSIYINADPDDFPSIIINKNDKEIIINDYEENYFNGYKFFINCGATKIVFIFDDFDKVIKIPFNGEYYPVYEQGEIIGISYKNFDNYIEIENKIYDDANEHLKHILLKNNFIKKFGDINIYTQTKIFKTFRNCDAEKRYSCEPFVDNIVRNFIFERINAKDKENPLPDRRFLVDIVLNYSDADFIIPEIDFKDMHKNNYGYLKNGMPVIFDFSGFTEGY